jgi:hypothetical protein
LLQLELKQRVSKQIGAANNLAGPFENLKAATANDILVVFNFSCIPDWAKADATETLLKPDFTLQNEDGVPHSLRAEWCNLAFKGRETGRRVGV